MHFALADGWLGSSNDVLVQSGMLCLELGEWSRCIFREAIENHLQALPPARGDLIQRINFLLLTGVLKQVMESALAIDNMIPVTNHPEFADL